VSLLCWHLHLVNKNVNKNAVLLLSHTADLLEVVLV
jgi:hypothetical protein